MKTFLVYIQLSIMFLFTFASHRGGRFAQTSLRDKGDTQLLPHYQESPYGGIIDEEPVRPARVMRHRPNPSRHLPIEQMRELDELITTETNRSRRMKLIKKIFAPTRITLLFLLGISQLVWIKEQWTPLNNPQVAPYYFSTSVGLLFLIILYELFKLKTR